MKRSITCVGLTLGTAAMLTLGLGCSHENPPPQPPSIGTTSPPTESSVPPASSVEQGRQGTGEMGAGVPQAPGQPSAAPSAPAPSSAEPRAMEPPQGATAGPNERELCDALSSGAKLHVEDVQRGVAIVATPRSGTSLSALRDDAKRIEKSIQEHAGAGAPAGSEACGIFSIARLPSVSTNVTEAPGSVRIVMTTSNANEVKDLRRVAREQVGSLSKGTEGTHSR